MLVEGKIFVVVLVLAVIFTGIAAFMIYTDVRLRKIEKQIKKK